MTPPKGPGKPPLNPRSPSIVKTIKLPNVIIRRIERLGPFSSVVRRCIELALPLLESGEAELEDEDE